VLSHAERGRVISDEHRKRVFLSAARVRATFLIDALLPEARSRGYDRAQLWTQSDNARARGLYEGRGFAPSGREKDEFGERIVHYQRALPETV
jgi:GNAT superfamily N-acetyltransferase